jgi:hypothetical protein
LRVNHTPRADIRRQPLSGKRRRNIGSLYIVRSDASWGHILNPCIEQSIFSAIADAGSKVAAVARASTGEGDDTGI